MKLLPKAIALLGMVFLLVSLTLSAAINTPYQAIGSSSTGLLSTGSIDSPTSESRLSGSPTFDTVVPNSSDASLAPSLAVAKSSSSINERFIGNSLAEYQADIRNANYQIPPYVLLNRDGMLPGGGFGLGGANYNPNIGGQGLEIMFSAQEIYNAMQAGYAQLQNAMASVGTWPWIPAREQYAQYAQANFPRWGRGNSIRFPNELRAEQTPRPPTLGNRVNNGNFDDGGWPGNRLQTDVFANQRIFTFPLLPQRTTFDGSTAPGPYRVVFNQDGQYMGVVRHRTEKMRNGAQKNSKGKDGDWNDKGRQNKMSWLNPVHGNGQPIYKRHVGGNNFEWPYPGTPVAKSAQPEYYLTPFNWAWTGDLVAVYDAIRKASPASMLDTVGNSTNDFNNTGSNGRNGANWYSQSELDKFSKLSIAGNSSVASQRTGANGLNCDTAKQYLNQTYSVSCNSQHQGKDKFEDFRISATGIGGDDGAGWCAGIRDNIYGECGGNGNFEGDIYCDSRNTGNVQLYHNQNTGQIDWVWGIEMQFRFAWPWAERDADHDCVQLAIEKGSCLSHWVDPMFPVVCRDYDYFNASLTEFDWDWQGPPDQKAP